MDLWDEYGASARADRQQRAGANFLYSSAGVARDRFSLGLLRFVATSNGNYGIPKVLQKDGFCPIYVDVEFVAVHVVAAYKNGAEMDSEFEVYRGHS